VEAVRHKNQSTVHVDASKYDTVENSSLVQENTDSTSAMEVEKEVSKVYHESSVFYKSGTESMYHVNPTPMSTKQVEVSTVSTLTSLSIVPTVIYKNGTDRLYNASTTTLSTKYVKGSTISTTKFTKLPNFVPKGTKPVGMNIGESKTTPSAFVRFWYSLTTTKPRPKRHTVRSTRIPLTTPTTTLPTMFPTYYCLTRPTPTSIVPPLTTSHPTFKDIENTVPVMTNATVENETLSVNLVKQDSNILNPEVSSSLMLGAVFTGG
jgi:hypothetical protein